MFILRIWHNVRCRNNLSEVDLNRIEDHDLILEINFRSDVPHPILAVKQTPHGQYHPSWKFISIVLSAPAAEVSLIKWTKDVLESSSAYHFVKHILRSLPFRLNMLFAVLETISLSFTAYLEARTISQPSPFSHSMDLRVLSTTKSRQLHFTLYCNTLNNGRFWK